MSDSLTLVLGSSSSPSVDLVRSVTDTGELRWFAPGAIPPEVLTWFAGSVAEERRDTYRLDGRDDMGLKMRSGELLELKVRQSVDAVTLALSDELTGRLEGWRRWSPADGLIELSPGDQWVDVQKRIVKRRFLDHGIEAEVDPRLPLTDFCDVELTALAVDGARWWSLALAAYGAPATRPWIMRGAWDAMAAAPPPLVLEAVLGEQSGYPAWLADCIRPAIRASTPDVATAG